VTSSRSLSSSLNEGETATKAATKNGQKVFFDAREELICPNDCSPFLSSQNACKGNVCECAPGFSGADCSYNSNECKTVNKDLIKNDALEYWGKKKQGQYDGIIQAHTHIILADLVMQNRVPGDVVELGVFKGGSASVLYRTFSACSSKRFWFYDSFQGHPDINQELNPGMQEFVGRHIGTLDETKANMHAFNPGHDESRIKWKKGFFNVTLLEELPKTISYLHIDCDWYECHIDILDVLYDRVAFGGAIVTDDTGFYGFARAGLMDWLQQRKKVVTLRSTFGIEGGYGGGSQFWIKGGQGYHTNQLVNQDGPLWPGGVNPPVFL